MASITTTAHALLGLLALRSWTAYELTQQMRRALRWVWPRSETNLYNEIKGLVPLGLAEATEEEADGRARTRYAITERGAAALREWLGRQPPAPPQVQCEALLRVFLADSSTLDDLRSTIEATRRQVSAQMAEVLPVLEEYDRDEGAFPHRAHLNVLFIHFMAGFFRHVLTWCDEAEAEASGWPSTAGVGMTPGTRRMLHAAVDLYRATTAGHGGEEGRH